MAATRLSSASISGGLARACRPYRIDDAIEGLTGVPLVLHQLVAVLAQARQGRPGGVGEPSHGCSKLSDTRAAVPLQHANDVGLLRFGGPIRGDRGVPRARAR